MIAYERIEGPIGVMRDDVLSASLHTLIANVNRDTKKRKKPFTIKDFMMRWDQKDDQEQTVEEQQSLFRRFSQVFSRGDK